MTEQKTKIDGKFYPLQNDEWLKACKELKPAELKLLYHLRTLDPFGDRNVELGVTALAHLLGMSKSTVSEGLKALSQKGWIDLEIIKVKVRLKTFAPANTVRPSELEFAPANNRGLKPSLSKAPSSLRLIQTIKTLSQTARERKIRFLKILPQPLFGIVLNLELLSSKRFSR